MNKRLIFLIGFMGAGKTFRGKQLSESLGLPFFDMDAFIENKAGRSVSEIFELDGAAAFRNLERMCLRDFSVLGDAVIATGGGTPCFFDNMEWMNENGHTIYLKASPAILFNRLKDEKAERPLIAKLSDEDLEDFIEEKLKERSTFYEQAKEIIEVTMND